MEFTLDDIKNYLKELGLDWSDAVIYNSWIKKYGTATINTFRGQAVSLYVKNMATGKYMSANVLITEKDFIINNGLSKLDASQDWVQYLLEQTKKDDI